jgi:hypothetical protein
VIERLNGAFPFTPAEEEFAALDRPSQPATCHYEIRTPTDFDPGSLCDAVRAAVAVHPMTRVSKQSGRRFLHSAMWAHDGLSFADVVQVACCDNDGTLSRVRGAFVGGQVDARHAPLLRLLLLKPPGPPSSSASITPSATASG